MAISDWPENERPREKLLRHGARMLSDAELLAVLLGSGRPGKSAVDLARETLARWGSLTRLLTAPRSEFCSMAGLGDARYAQLQAVTEMTRRALAEPLQERDALTSPDLVRDFLRLNLAGLEHEVFCAVFLDSQHRMLAMEELFRGTLGETSVYPREIVKRALARNAAALIFAHNHPSGSARASEADRVLTRQLRSALALVDVRVLDHFIVTQHDARSMAETGEI